MGQKKGGKKKRELDNNSVSVVAVVTLVISFFHKTLKGVAMGQAWAAGCGVTLLCVCVSDTKGYTEGGTGKG